MSYSMSIRSRAAKTYGRRRRRPAARRARVPAGGSGMSTPASASTVGARSMKLTSSSLTDPGATVDAERLRPADHQRHAQSRVVERPLGARHAVAVIAPVEDDGVVGQAVGVELVEDLRRPARPCRRCCRTCARALRAPAACPGSTAAPAIFAGSVTSGLPFRAGLDGKIWLSCVTLRLNTEKNGWFLSGRLRQCAVAPSSSQIVNGSPNW